MIELCYTSVEQKRVGAGSMGIIGARVKDLRFQHKLEALDLAYHAGISEGYVYRIESKNPPNVGGEILVKLAAVLGTTTDYLLGMTDNPGPPIQDDDVPCDCSRCPRDMREIVYRLIEVWDEIAEMDESGESLDRLLTVVTTQAEAFKAAMQAMKRQVSEEPAQNTGES